MKKQNKHKNVKGFKVFNPDWTCQDFQYQYEVGKTYEEDVDLSVFVRGFHFCTDVKDCFNYHDFDPNNKVAEIIALGEVQEEDDTCCTDKIEIVREISWEEVLRLCNTGQGCTGLNNTGNRNSGDSNSGNRNSGNFNSGNRNTGDYNTGSYHTGDWNTGSYNTGDYNTGSHNAGDWNTGSYNTGDYNTGDWNMTSQATGCFNTKRQDLRFFDKETSMTFEEWRESNASRLLTRIDFMGTSWIHSWQMTEEEKKEHPEHETTGGYLKVSDIKEACTKWWDELSYYERKIIKDIPNFDAKKFFQITGIEVEA